MPIKDQLMAANSPPRKPRWLLVAIWVATSRAVALAPFSRMPKHSDKVFWGKSGLRHEEASSILGFAEHEVRQEQEKQETAAS